MFICRKLAKKQMKTVFKLASFATLSLVLVLLWSNGNQELGADYKYYISMNSIETEVHQIASATDKLTMILTYMRSGSSLTGDIIQQNPETFYVFEPFHIIDIYSSKNQPVVMFNEEERYYKPEQFLDVARPITESLFRCKFENIFCSTLRDGLFMGHSLKTWDYRQCVVNLRPVDKNCRTVLERCIPILRQTCQESNNILIKTIRLPMDFMGPFMEKYQNLKIIHLLRDPRPTLRSEIATGLGRWENISNFSQEFCKRVQNDLDASKDFEVRFPGRIMKIRYEDLAQYPIELSGRMYDFLGLEFTDTIKKYIMSKTYGGKDPEVKMDKWKENATETMLQWRLITPIKHVKTIDTNCQQLYDQLGYLPALTEEELKDLSRPLNVALG